MKRKKYGNAARLFFAGEIEFAEFAERTRPSWTAWASDMTRRWGPLPNWFGFEDIKQEVLYELWRAKGTFDPKRGTEPGVYSKFAAKHTAAKKVHKARGAEQHRRSGPSRFDIAVDFDEAEPSTAYGKEAPSTPEQALARAEYYRILRALCATPAQLEAVQALERSGGTLEGAAALLWRNRDSRLACQLVSEEHAARVIDRSVEELVDNYGIEEEAQP